jgi:hypothetical protein
MTFLLCALWPHAPLIPQLLQQLMAKVGMTQHNRPTIWRASFDRPAYDAGRIPRPEGGDWVVLRDVVRVEHPQYAHIIDNKIMDVVRKGDGGKWCCGGATTTGGDMHSRVCCGVACLDRVSGLHQTAGMEGVHLLPCLRLRCVVLLDTVHKSTRYKGQDGIGSLTLVSRWAPR